MIHIGIDCRFSFGHSGVGRYTREIVPPLLSGAGNHRFTLFVRSSAEEWLKNLSGNYSILEVDIPHYSLQEQMALPSHIRKSGIDLLFSPHFNVPLSLPVPYVVTIHDLILHRYPNQASLLRQWAYRFLMRQSVRRAERIIAVSAFTAGELVDVYGEAVAAKVVPIHEGISPRFSPRSEEEQHSVCRAYGITRDFFLYVGNAKEHKNVQLLVDAFVKAHLSDADLVLVTSGRETKRLNLPPNVMIVHSVADEDLPALYSAARATVTASLYEGYCFPVLEAAACGCPVIATNSSAIAEIAPSGALLVNATLDALTSAFTHPPTCCGATVEPFSWEEAGRKTLALLREVYP